MSGAREELGRIADAAERIAFWLEVGVVLRADPKSALSFLNNAALTMAEPHLSAERFREAVEGLRRGDESP